MLKDWVLAEHNGYRRLTVMLRREGWKVNIKRVYRLYREDNLGVRTAKRKKRGTHLRVPLPEVHTSKSALEHGFCE